MKTLIVYYTRTSTTKKVAEKLQEKLGCDIEEIIDKKDWAGPLGWLKAGKYGGAKKLTEIEEVKKSPKDYDCVIIGTPVWVGNMTAAIRTYIEKHKDDFPEVAFFSTQGSEKKQRVFDDLKECSKKDPIAEFFISTKKVKQDRFEDVVNEFVERLK